MVRNYCKIIELTGADAGKVLGTVRGYLFSQPYTKQKDGLVEALIQGGAHKADGTPLKVTEIKTLVKECLRLSEEMYDKYVKLSLGEK